MSPSQDPRRPGEEELRTLWHRTLLSIPGSETLAADATLKVPPAPGPARPARPGESGFALLGELGRGGMGVVFRGRQLSLDREIAVKRVHPELGAEAAGTFVSEARVTGRLDHPNIVPVYELASTPEGDVLLAMKLVGGRPWKRILHPATPEDRLAASAYDAVAHLGVLLNVANAVAFAHSRGILHRDLKPENVMVGEFGEVLVMDWGLAVDFRDPPSSPGVPHRSGVTGPAGTPAYMAPEQAEGRGADLGPGTDVYLLGAILHEILVGVPPHRGATVWDTVAAAARAEPPAFPGGLPEELKAICRRALAREPRDRHATANEFRLALQDHLRHRESTSISSAASALLENSSREGSRDRRYGTYAEAIAGFRQAKLLWTGNPEAGDGERRARIAFAEEALAGGDLGLAEVQAPEGEIALKTRITEARERIRRSTRQARITRAALAGSVAVILAGLGVGLYAVDAERKRTREERDRAIAERRIAQEQKRLADERLAHSHLLRAREAEAAGHPAAPVLFAEAYRARPSDLTRASAARAPGSLWAGAAHHHGHGIHAIAFSPDGTRLVTASQDGSAVIREASTGAPVGRPLGPHEGGVLAVAFSPDGRLVATGGRDKIARIWTAESGVAASPPLPHADEVRCVAFSPDGLRIATGCGQGTARLWNATDGSPATAPIAHGGEVRFVGFSPDGGRLAIAHAGGLHVVEARRGGTLGVPVNLEGRLMAFAMNLAGTRAVTGTARGGIHVWELPSGRHVAEAQADGPWVQDLDFSPDGSRFLSCGNDRAVRIWETESGTPQGRPLPHGEDVHLARFSPDGLWIVTADLGRELRVWRRETGKPASRAMNPGQIVSALTFSPDGRTLAFGDQVGWSLTLDLEAIAPRPALPFSRFDRVVFSPDFRLLASGGVNGTLQVVEAGTGAPVGPLRRHGSEILALAFAPDGGRLLTAGAGGSVRVWATAGGEDPIATAEVARDVERAAFSPDGTLAYLVSSNGDLLRWTIGPTPPRALPMGDKIDRFAILPDGARLFSVSSLPSGRTARLRDAATGDPLGDPLHHATPVAISSVAVSPDGTLGVTGGEWVQFWDLASGQPVRRKIHPGAPVAALALSPDGRWLLTGDEDHRVRLWEAASGEPVGLPIVAEGGIRSVAFSSDGRRIAVTCEQAPPRTWDLSPILETEDPEVVWLRAQARTGYRLDPAGALEPVPAGDLDAIRRRLRDLDPRRK